MKFKHAMFFAVLSTGIGIAGADEFKSPPMKDGFWETRIQQFQEGKIVSDSSVKNCLTKELMKSMEATGAELRKKDGCTSSVTRSSPNTYIEETRCTKGQDGGSVTKAIYTHQGDTASHTEIHMNVGKSESVMISDAKYLGSCPAGLKPGDGIAADGKKFTGGE